MIIQQHGTSLLGWVDGRPAVQMSWEPASRGWYINDLVVERPALMAALLSRFRQVWRDSGRPVLTFHASPHDQAMRRLVALLGAATAGDGYVIEDLEQASTRRN